MKIRAGFLLVSCIVAAAGCASSSAASEGGSQARGSNVITREEIRATTLGNMLDVIQQLRPQFLRARGRTSINLPSDQIAVYMDDVHVGGVGVLSSIAASAVTRVEFIRGPDTGFKFGLEHQAGVIHIITR